MPFPKPGGGSGITQLTGDAAAGPGSGSQPLTLASVVGAGTVGDTTHYPIVTFDAKGRVTGASAQAAPGPANGIGVITGDLTTPPASTPAQSVAGTLASVGTAGTYGSASRIPVITTDAKGRVTAVGEAVAAAGALTSAALTGLSSGASVALPNNTPTTVSTTVSLAVGTWLIDVNVTAQSSLTPAAADQMIGSIAVGTATATIVGHTGPFYVNEVAGTQRFAASLHYNFIATVTVAGTFLIQVTYFSASAGSALQGQSGYTAVKIA
jgi:hypothetical protein